MRRVKRLLPAAYVTFCITAILSAILLTPWEYNAFVKQLLGSVTFFANIILFRQIDYFAGEAEIKPLLHTWSLAIEEQFYFVFPLVLLWTRKGLRLVVLLSLFGCSLALCMVLASIHPSASHHAQHRCCCCFRDASPLVQGLLAPAETLGSACPTHWTIGGFHLWTSS